MIRTFYVARARFFLGSLALLILCIPGDKAKAAEYFVDATSGNDANTGLSSALAWQTLAKVSGTILPAGSTVYLKRGETWHETLTAGSTVVIDAFGSGASPTLDGSFPISGWTNLGSGLYSRAVVIGPGQGLGNLSENGTMLAPLDWNTNLATTFAGAPTGTYSFDVGANTVYLKPAGNPGLSEYLVGLNLYGINVDGKIGVTIRNVRATRFSLNGIHLKNCANCSVFDAAVDSGGGAIVGNNPSSPPNYIYAGNGIDIANGSSNIAIDGVAVSNIFDSGIAAETYVSNSSMSNVTIRNSSADRCGFAGVEVSVLSNGGTTGSSMTGIAVSGVTATNSGRGWSGRRYGTEGYGMRIIADAGAGVMSGVSAQNVSISNSIGDGVKIAGEIGSVTLHRLNSTGNEFGVIAIDPTAASLHLTLTSSLIYANRNWGVAYNAPSAAGFNISQNTFYDNTTINVGVLNQSGTAKLLNNAFYSDAAMTHVYVNAALAGALVDNNCYNTLANMFGYNGSAYSTVAAFHAALGFETSGVGGDVALTAPASGNLTLQAGSQCRGRGGAAAGVALDYSGRRFASPPASGAYEYFTTNSSQVIVPEETYSYPNPVRTGPVSLRFYLTQASDITLEIFDSSHRRIHRENIAGALGRNVYRWTADGANGVYFWKLTTQGQSVVKKALVLR